MFTRYSSLLFIVFLLDCGCKMTAQTLYFPAVDSNIWDTLAPSELGWCQSEIDQLYGFLDSAGTRSFLLLKDGKIVLEQYFNGHTASDDWIWYSAGKSLRSALVGIARGEGYLNLDEKTSDYLGIGWTSLDQNEEDLIKIRNQLSMTSGLNEFWFTCVSPWCLTYVADAGDRWAYHQGPYDLTHNLLETATGMSLNEMTDTWIEDKIGMNGNWSSFPLVSSLFYNSTGRDMARYGLLVSNRGVWDTTVVIADTNYVDSMLLPSQTLNPGYGYLWWLNGSSFYIDTDGNNNSGWASPRAPSDAVMAIGLNSQLISISKSKGLVFIRQGNSETFGLTGLGMHDEIWHRITNLLCDSTMADVYVTESSIQINYDRDPNYYTIIGATEDYDIQILNAQGGLYEDISNSKNIDYEVGLLPSGLYFLKIQHKTLGALQVEKILVY